MQPSLRAALAAAAITAVSAATAALPGTAFPTFADAPAIAAACDRGLADAATALRTLEKQRPDGRWLARYDAFSLGLEDASNPIAFLANVHPDKAVRDAAEACRLRWQAFESSLGINTTLYRAVRAMKPADAVDTSLRNKLLEAFEDSGVALPTAAQREEAKRLQDRMAALGQTFGRNVREDATRVAFTEAELDGVPPSAWQTAPRDPEGRVLLGLDAPTVTAVLQAARNPATRERLWRARTNQGGEANLQILDELASLRRSYAKLFGFDSYADFVLRRRMVESTARATAFLDEVQGAVAAGERRDIAELLAAKVQDTGVATTKLERWDVAYYSERVKRATYRVDQEAFRPYFPPEESLAFVLRVAERLFGVRYERDAAAPGAWHPDVHAYTAIDAAGGKPLGTLYVDLYPREGKYNHAAVWGYRHGSTLAGRLPGAALVMNVNRKGLSLDELETLLHELGHALHNNLSATRYGEQSGTSVLRDFVEAPSQMLEDWVYDPKVIALFKDVCATCQPVPTEMLAQAKAARDWGRGLFYARQRLYAAYDLALHAREPQPALALWQRMEGATPLGYVDGTRFPAGFGHIASGYAAGYYGYLWSLVVALDLRTPFAADRLNAAAGMRYRKEILSQGGQLPPAQLVRNFLGRDANARALFEDLQRGGAGKP